MDMDAQVKGRLLHLNNQGVQAVKFQDIGIMVYLDLSTTIDQQPSTRPHSTEI